MKQISFLTSLDLATAWEIEQKSHVFPWSEKVFYSNQGEHYLNVKLMEGQKMAAFAICQQVLDEATLLNIAVAPAFRRNGYARALLSYLITELTARQVNQFWLEVRASNQAAIALYDQLGFNTVTIRHGYYPAYSGREDAVVMALVL